MVEKIRLYMGVRSGVIWYSDSEQRKNGGSRGLDKVYGWRGLEHANRETASDDYYVNASRRERFYEGVDQNQARRNGPHRDRQECEFS
jgi:hypothetical protein